MAGYARTVRYLPLREDLAAYGARMNAQKRAIEEIRPGEVLVIEARGDPTAGTIGDILGLRAQVRGAAGIVTDGAIRDSVALAGLEIPVYHAAVHPAVLGPARAVGDRRHRGVRRGDHPARRHPRRRRRRRGRPPAGIAADVLAEAREQERQEEFIASASPWATPSTACTRSATPAAPTTKPGSPSETPRDRAAAGSARQT